MSDASSSGFGKFVPGFDFLQSLAKGAAHSMPQMPTLNSWVAPTLSVEELDKRISELKAVQFWLDQNALALKATIQALEVQKMTLATLKGMNVSMSEVAKAFTPKPAEPQAAAPRAPERAPEPPLQVRAAEASEGEGDSDSEGRGEAKATVGAVDPMQWWGALTQQFQEIASAALKEATTRATPDPQRSQAAAPARSASARPKAGQAAAKAAPARKAAARKRAG